MLTYTNTFGSFSVDDLPRAKEFYGQTLGFKIHDEGKMGFTLRLKGDTTIFIYPKVDHQPATFTVLNFAVQDINATMESMRNQGIQFVHYHSEHLPQDEQGVLRGLSADMGPDIAWFKDPAGNVLSVLQEE